MVKDALIVMDPKRRKNVPMSHDVLDPSKDEFVDSVAVGAHGEQFIMAQLRMVY